MALFGNDYDRDLGYREGRRGAYHRPMFGYDRGYSGYDRGFLGFGGHAAGYDRNFKSQWQTDYGDPFGDRSGRTPMRAIRGPFRDLSGSYDRGLTGYDRSFSGYDRDLSVSDRSHRTGYGDDYRASNPMSYEPYRRGTWNRYDRQFGRGYGRDRDSGWF